MITARMVTATDPISDATSSSELALNNLGITCLCFCIARTGRQVGGYSCFAGAGTTGLSQVQERPVALSDRKEVAAQPVRLAIVPVPAVIPGAGIRHAVGFSMPSICDPQHCDL